MDSTDIRLNPLKRLVGFKVPIFQRVKQGAAPAFEFSKESNTLSVEVPICLVLKFQIRISVIHTSCISSN